MKRSHTSSSKTLLLRGAAIVFCLCGATACLEPPSGVESENGITTAANHNGTGGTNTGGTNTGGTNTGGTNNGGGNNTPPFGAGGGGSSSALTGIISFDQTTGQITGNAYVTSNPSNSTSGITVSFYINGPSGTGALLATLPANQQVISGGYYNGFIYQPASAYVDSTPRKLYAYMNVPGSSTPTLIGGAAIDYFGGPDAKGLAYFNANVAPLISGSTACKNCHNNGAGGVSWANYYTTRQMLAEPTPLSGGTATNNSFYMNISGGLNHPGGNQCNSIANLCAKVSAWWATDFGK